MAKNYIIKNIVPIANMKVVQKIFLEYNTFENVFNQEFADFFIKNFNAQEVLNHKTVPFYLLGLDKKQRILVSEVNNGKGVAAKWVIKPEK